MNRLLFCDPDLRTGCRDVFGACVGFTGNLAIRRGTFELNGRRVSRLIPL